MENKSQLPGSVPMQEIIRMASSPAGQKLIALMQQQGGAEFQRAMEQASSGDYMQAKRAIEMLLRDPQAQQLLKELGR